MHDEKITRYFEKDDTGCEHSNADSAVGLSGEFEEFWCSKCSHLILRKIDSLRKPTGESYIRMAQ
jgi:hypothetical protein